MAAGLGYIEFATGDVLTAALANGYLASQTVMVFASAAARTSAITSPQEGMISYLKDTNATQYYSGSAWTDIGAASGGMTLLASGSMSGSQTSITTLSGSYETLVCYVMSPTNSNAENFCVRLNNDTGSNYGHTGTSSARTTTVQSTGATSIVNDFPVNVASGSTQGWQITIQNYTAGNYKTVSITGAGVNSGTKYVSNITGMWASTSAVTEIDLFPLAGTWSAGTYEVWGVK